MCMKVFKKDLKEYLPDFVAVGSEISSILLTVAIT